MAIIRNDSQQTMANISVTREDGQRVQVVSASCHIRPEKGLSINVDTLDATAITDANRSEVGEAWYSSSSNSCRELPSRAFRWR